MTEAPEVGSKFWMTVLPGLYATTTAPCAPRTVLPLPTRTTFVPGSAWEPAVPAATAGAVVRVTVLPATTLGIGPPRVNRAVPLAVSRLGS